MFAKNFILIFFFFILPQFNINEHLTNHIFDQLLIFQLQETLHSTSTKKKKKIPYLIKPYIFYITSTIIHHRSLKYSLRTDHDILTRMQKKKEKKKISFVNKFHSISRNANFIKQKVKKTGRSNMETRELIVHERSNVRKQRPLTHDLFSQ